MTASDDGTARVWFVQVEDLVRLADGRIIGDFTTEEVELYGELLSEDAKARASASWGAGAAPAR